MKKLFLLLIIFNLSCKNEIISYPPENLEIISDKPGRHYPMRLGCSWPKSIDSLNRDFKYLRVYDKTSVDEFLRLLNECKKDTTDFGADVRIKILIHQGTKTDTLCLGENFGIIKNGVSLSNSKELVNFVKKRIKYYER